jgi:hypothetical protein
VLGLCDVGEQLNKGLAVGQLISNKVVDGLEHSPVSVVVKLSVLVEDPLFRAHLVYGNFR